MGFSFKGLFCGSEPNKTKIKNEINQRFSNKINNDVRSLAEILNNIITTSVTEIVNNTDISAQNSAQLSQALNISGSTISGSTLNFNYNASLKTAMTQYATVMTNTQKIEDIRNDVIAKIKAQTKGDTNFNALLSSMNSANNKQSELTQGEMNNMINKLTGLFDYSSTNTDINNTVTTELENVITNRISNDNVIKNTIDTLFKSQTVNDTDNACKQKTAGEQLANIVGTTIENGSTINVNFNMILDSVTLCTTNTIIANSTLQNAMTKLKSDQESTAESKISASITMKMSNDATNISDQKTTSFVNSFFDMIMYIGIAGVVLLTVVAIVFLLRKGPNKSQSSDTPTNISDTSRVNLPFNNTVQKGPTVPPIKGPTSSPIKAPMKGPTSSPIKAPNVPTKRIPGLPKF
jgi:hypothetical protein